MRFRARDGKWSSWVSAGANRHGPEARPAVGRQVGEPIWTGGATAVQVRATRTLRGAQLHLVDVSGGEGAARLAHSALQAALSAGLPLATPTLSAGPGQPPIIARRVWAQAMAPPRVAPEYGAVRMAFVHHTENPNGYAASEVPAMLRAIYVYHRYVNGWNDIGYNFAIDLYGRIFEARAGGIDEPVVGAQAGGYNLVSTGIAVLGTFTAVPISQAARSALESLLAWKLSLHGVPSEGRVTVRVNPAGASYSRFPANARVSLPQDRRPSRRRRHGMPRQRPLRRAARDPLGRASIGAQSDHGDALAVDARSGAWRAGHAGSRRRGQRRKRSGSGAVGCRGAARRHPVERCACADPGSHGQ